MISNIKGVNEVMGQLAAIWAPHTLESVCDWVEGNVEIPTGQITGPVRLRRTPYAREILERYGDKNTRHLILAFATQLAKTSILIMGMLYRIARDPEDLAGQLLNPHHAYPVGDRFLLLNRGRSLGDYAKTDIKLEPVAYRGAAAMVNDLAGGRLPACLTSTISLLEHHRGPRLKIVLSSAAERSKLSPNVPTAAELGYPDLQVREWFGFFVSSEVPAATIEEWNRHIAAVCIDGEVKAELLQLGLEVSPTSVADAGPIVAGYMQEWKDRLQAAGIKPPK